jgi:hypothetical protein
VQSKVAAPAGAVLQALAQPKPPDPFDAVAPAVAPPAPASGPYQGAAGSEASNPGQQRVPPPDWANPASANYERRNYYLDPTDGHIVAREPGYYNPDNPWDTGRPNETQGEYRGMDIGGYERRMDEPGITPWGPQGHPSAPGSFSAPGGSGAGAGAVSHPQGLGIARGLLSPDDEQSAQTPAGGLAGQDPQSYLGALFAALLGGLPGKARSSYPA